MSVQLVSPLKAKSIREEECTLQKAARRVCSAGLSCSPDAGGAYGQDSVRVVGPTRVHSESHPYAHDQRSILRAYGGMSLDMQDAPVLANVVLPTFMASTSRHFQSQAGHDTPPSPFLMSLKGDQDGRVGK